MEGKKNPNYAPIQVMPAKCNDADEPGKDTNFYWSHGKRFKGFIALIVNTALQGQDE